MSNRESKRKRVQGEKNQRSSRSARKTENRKKYATRRCGTAEEMQRIRNKAKRIGPREREEDIRRDTSTAMGEEEESKRIVRKEMGRDKKEERREKRKVLGSWQTAITTKCNVQCVMPSLSIVNISRLFLSCDDRTSRVVWIF